MKFNRAIPLVLTMSAAVTAALLAAPLASGAEGAKSDNPKFVKLDKNRDGYLTRDEVRSIRHYGQAFDQADENKDGKLDQAEFIKAEAIHDRVAAGKYVEDGVLTAKVKAALLKEPELKSMDVSVETLKGEVLLSGFVRDESQRAKAVKVANSVNGVASVKDAMVVR
jgi:hyperosmotically inducible periplasmic protein